MESLGIPLQRNSQDRKKNNIGLKLIDMLKNLNLIIVNGRFPCDKNGKMTFRNISVIDYLICTLQSYDFFINFEVIQVDNLFSDGHCLLDYILKLNLTYLTNLFTKCTEKFCKQK